VSFEAPVGSVRRVEHPVVQPVLTTLPELEEDGCEFEPTPVGGPRDVTILEDHFEFANPLFEIPARVQRLALVARVRTYLVTAGTGIKIRIGFGSTH
jgi:hypothetical protein